MQRSAQGRVERRRKQQPALAPQACGAARRETTRLGHRVHAHAGAVDLDLVGVHRRVGDENLGVHDALGLPHADLLVQDEALVEKSVAQRAARLLDDLDGLQVAGACGCAGFGGFLVGF